MLRDEIAKLNDMGLLDELLKDKSTDKNILWATKAYSHLGKEYAEDEEITADLIIGKNCGVITNRAQKEKEAKATRTKQYAEVFTPFWICKRMNDSLDDDWLDCVDEEENVEALEFREGKTWQDYVSSVRMEITCGEAPFLTSRYDVATGEDIPLDKRIGLLDRKLKAVCENTDSLEEWLGWVEVAFRSTYGYEFQGDNLLIARINLLMTFVDSFVAKWGRAPEKDQYTRIIEIIAWNIWQMDGLTNCVPYSEPEKEVEQITLDNLFGAGDDKECLSCKIYDWKDDKIIKYSTISKRSSKMKFDYIIGNPPYQDETIGDNKSFAPPIYDKFLDSASELADCFIMIHPARFLFNAGATSETWNKKMLNDKHYKLLDYFSKSSDVFPDTDIMGGVAITCYDNKQVFEPIRQLIVFDELKSILDKVESFREDSLTAIIYASETYRFTEKMHVDFPNAESILSKGHKYGLKSSVLKSLDNIVFFSNRPSDGEYVKILGLIQNLRIYRWIKQEYIVGAPNFEYYKVFVPNANGSGALGGTQSTPIIGQPLIGQPFVGHTQSFISIGKFETIEHANACMKYVKTKFCRALIGILKITQSNSRPVWQYVPMQDFTDASNINWSKSVREIDEQLYKKYGLSDDEIAFIESHVKEME